MRCCPAFMRGARVLVLLRAGFTRPVQGLRVRHSKTLAPAFLPPADSLPFVRSFRGAFRLWGGGPSDQRQPWPRRSPFPQIRILIRPPPPPSPPGRTARTNNQSQEATERRSIAAEQDNRQTKSGRQSKRSCREQAEPFPRRPPDSNY